MDSRKRKNTLLANLNSYNSAKKPRKVGNFGEVVHTTTPNRQAFLEPQSPGVCTEEIQGGKVIEEQSQELSSIQLTLPKLSSLPEIKEVTEREVLRKQQEELLRKQQGELSTVGGIINALANQQLLRDKQVLKDQQEFWNQAFQEQFHRQMEEKNLRDQQGQNLEVPESNLTSPVGTRTFSNQPFLQPQQFYPPHSQPTSIGQTQSEPQNVLNLNTMAAVSFVPSGRLSLSPDFSIQSKETLKEHPFQPRADSLAEAKKNLLKKYSEMIKKQLELLETIKLLQEKFPLKAIEKYYKEASGVCRAMEEVASRIEKEVSTRTLTHACLKNSKARLNKFTSSQLEQQGVQDDQLTKWKEFFDSFKSSYEAESRNITNSLTNVNQAIVPVDTINHHQPLVNLFIHPMQNDPVTQPLEVKTSENDPQVDKKEDENAIFARNRL